MPPHLLLIPSIDIFSQEIFINHLQRTCSKYKIWSYIYIYIYSPNTYTFHIHSISQARTVIISWEGQTTSISYFSQPCVAEVVSQARAAERSGDLLYPGVQKLLLECNTPRPWTPTTLSTPAHFHSKRGKPTLLPSALLVKQGCHSKEAGHSPHP